MGEIEYGNPLWMESEDAANAEARRRACLTRDAEAAEDREVIWYSDLGALTVLPQELAEIAGLKRLIIGDAEIPGAGAFAPPQKLKDWDVLERMTQLQDLNLADCEVGGRLVFSSMTALQSLNLYRTRVDDLSALSGLTALQSLNLSGTEVDDLSALSGLTALQSLDLFDTRVDDLSALSGLTALQSLNLSGTQVDNLSALSGLTALQSLDLFDTRVDDLSALSGLTALQSLDLSGTRVDDLSALSGLTALQSLNLSGTRVDDLSVLLEMPKFAALQAKTLYFHGTPLARQDRRWQMLAGLDAKTAAKDVVLYLKGEHPDLQPPLEGGLQATGVAGLAAAAPVELVEEGGKAELADRQVFHPPVPQNNMRFAAGLQELHAVACGLAEELVQGVNVPPALLRRVAVYSEACDPARKPVFATLEGTMVLLRPLANDPYILEPLDAGLRAGLGRMLVLHDALDGPEIMPDPLPELPRAPKDPLDAAELEDKIKALAEIVKDGVSHGMMGSTVVVAVNSTVDVVNSANSPLPQDAGPVEATQQKGKWSWATRMAGGLAWAMEQYGKVHGWLSTPAGISLMQRVSELLDYFVKFFS